MKPEEELHAKIKKLLDGLGILYVHSRTDKRTTQQKGVPDFLFAVRTKIPDCDHPIAWECKVDGRKLSDDQEQWKMKAQSGRNGWHYYVITNLTDACEALKPYGVISY